MEKTTFQGIVRACAAASGAPRSWESEVAKLESEVVNGLRTHDPKLADLFAAQLQAIAAVNDYCAARLEGR